MPRDLSESTETSRASKRSTTEEKFMADGNPTHESESDDDIEEGDGDIEESNVIQAAIIGTVCLVVFLGVLFLFHAKGPERRSQEMPNSEGPGDAAPGSRSRDGAGNKWSSNGRARGKIELGSRRRTPHGYPDPYPRRPSGPQNPGKTVQAEDATMRSQISGSAPASVAADDAAATMPATISGAESDGRLAEGTKGIIVLPPLPKSARPLVCVASNTRNRTIFPEDGLCDYLIFHDVTLGDSEWVSATNRGKLDPFIEKASRSRQSVYMLSFPANIYAEVKSFLQVRDTSVQLIKKYATHNIRGYGFALIDRPVRRFVGEAEHYKDIIMNLSDRMKEAMNTGGVTFMGLLLRGNAKGSVGNELKELVKRVDLFVAISHTPLPDTPGTCLVQPISSWSSEHLNDASLQSISSAVKILQDCKSRERTSFALSSSLSVLKFNIHKDSARGAEGIWNVKCTGTALEAFEQVCSLRMTPGSIGVTDFVVYDFDAKKLVWRSYETIESLRSKISKVFEVLDKIRPSPLGWALYDVDFEDYKGSCNKDFSRSQLDTSRIRWLKDFLLNSSSAPHAAKKRR